MPHEKYIFTDGADTIRFEIDEKTRIEIRGEVKKDFLTPSETDVDIIRRIAQP